MVGTPYGGVVGWFHAGVRPWGLSALLLAVGSPCPLGLVGVRPLLCVGVGGDSLEVGVWVLVGRGWLLVVVLLWVWSVWFCLPGWRSPCGVSSWGCGGLFLVSISLVGWCVWRWVSFRVCEGAKVCHPRCGVLGSVP